MKRIFVDTEYCYPGMKRGQPRPTAADTRQLVQIAAIIFDDTSGEQAAFDQLVLPTYERQLPDFFTELTGITREDIEKSAISLEKAVEKFARFCGDIPVWTFDKDEEVFRQNCRYIGLTWPFRQPFVRVKPLLSDWGVDATQYSSGTLYKAAGIEIDGRVHNALHDVRSMAPSVREFERRAAISH